MRWSYKTVHFELKKEGLLGGSFLDEAEIEEQLNQYGRSEWELISVIEVHNGIICFFRQPLTSESMIQVERLVDSVEEYPSEEHPYDEDRFDPYQEEELVEPNDPDEPSTPDELTGPDDPELDEFEVYEEPDYDIKEDVNLESYEDEPDNVDDVAEGTDEKENYPDDYRIGAIRIE